MKRMCPYLNFDLKEKDVRFWLLKFHCIRYSRTNNREIFRKGSLLITYNYILVNHRIWPDDTLLSKKPMDHELKQLPEEIYPLIKNRGIIFNAGNGKRQF